MELTWFALAWCMLAVYVVLDGFDFGVGVLHLFVARTDGERRQTLAAIGPFWDGNEVWLVAGGGVLFLAFPKVLGSGLSGFYLAAMMLLWVLILRGIAIEFRSHLGDGMWRAFWDAVFALASALAPILLGAALGNLLRGVPLNEDGWFALSLFESFSPHGELGILDWYTVLAALLALVALTHHGALFLAWKTDGPVRARSLRLAAPLLAATVVLWAVCSAATAAVVPGFFGALASRPAAWGFSLVAVAGLAASGIARRGGRDREAFVGSALYLLGVLAATAAAAWPILIRSIDTPAWSLTAFNASAPAASLRAGLWWWPVGLVLAVFYLIVLLRLHRGKVQVEDEGY